MASLSLTVTERLSLNGDNYGSVRTVDYANINNAYKQTFEVPADAPKILLSLGSDVGGGAVVQANLRYLRFRNNDPVNYVTLGFGNTGAQQAFFKLPPGGTFILEAPAIDANAAGAAFSSWGDIDAISAKADTAKCLVEMLVATA